MKKRITTLLLALLLVASLIAATGCSSDSDSEKDASQMTEEERDRYILEHMVGDGAVLTEQELFDNGYELSTDGETENMIKLLSNDSYSLYVDFQSADFMLVDEAAGFIYSSNSQKTTAGSQGGSDILQLEAYDNANKKYNFTTSEDCVEDLS